MKRDNDKQEVKMMTPSQGLTSSGDMLSRALEGELSEEEVYNSASAVVEAAILGELSNVSRTGMSETSLFFREPRTPEHRDKMVRSLIAHPERTRRLFRG